MPSVSGRSAAYIAFFLRIVLVCALLRPEVLFGARSINPEPVPVQPPEAVDAAIRKAAGFLVRTQSPDGGFVDPSRNTHAIAMTALSLMALASVGHQPVDKSPEGQAMYRGLNYILRPTDTSPQFLGGYYGKLDNSRMYGQGIITLALTELMGMGATKAQDTLIQDRAIRGINVILRAQQAKKHDPKFYGGWRYQPSAGDADLSVSVWQLMALRSARNAGLGVSTGAIDAAVGYLRRSYHSGRDSTGKATNSKSGFGYTPGQGPTYAMTAAGLLAMQVTGNYDAPETLGAARWLGEQRLNFNSNYFLYGTYYYSQGMKKIGGETARKARQAVENTLLPNQSGDGSWTVKSGSESKHGRIYTTTLAMLSLSVKFNFLPIYQD